MTDISVLMQLANFRSFVLFAIFFHTPSIISVKTSDMSCCKLIVVKVTSSSTVNLKPLDSQNAEKSVK